MLMPLNEAPFDRPLILVEIDNENFARRLQRIGLTTGSEIVRLDEDLIVRSVRVRGTRGDAILGGGMGLKTIVHLDRGDRMPLLDMEPGDHGHLEGVTGGEQLEHVLEVLGFALDGPVTLVRKLPPMRYITVTGDGRRLRLTDGDAAKLWGEADGRVVQFSLAPAARPFRVREILGGARAVGKIEAMGIRPGTILTLEGVEQGQQLHLGIGAGAGSDVVITSRDGLHLHLPGREGEHIIVRLKRC
ncbi:MAG: ferrous iron transport protein A [Deltaproteobacteria bacterium]|nr:ferrous iron transport protein A [Candidatus Anaeroferrophillacea bacterium]